MKTPALFGLCIAIVVLGPGGVSAPETEDGPPDPIIFRDRPAPGRADVFPFAGVSGEHGTWTVTYTAGEGGIATGGGLRVQLPDSWHAGARNSANRLQASDPGAAHFVSSRASRPGVELETVVESERENVLVKHPKRSLDGRFERYVFVVRVRVTAGRLEPGDRISVVYGDRRGGGPGLRAAAIATSPEPILVAVDGTGTGAFRLVEDPPHIVSLPGSGVELFVRGPTDAVAGVASRLLVTILDDQRNPVAHAAEVLLETVAGDAALAGRVRVEPARGFAEIEYVPRAAGVLRVRAVWPEGGLETGLETMSNPIVVHATAPRQRVFWGDLHSHTRFSWDGVGDRAFEYARNASGLDFYAMTDHVMAPVEDGRVLRGLCRELWEEYSALTERHHEPGRFVTLHGYECSFGRPWGHHNVYFRGRPEVAPMVYPGKETLPDLWKLLRAGDALTIPHHTGKFPAGVDLSTHDEGLRRNFEIYSGHGLSEARAPGHPLSFENSLFTAASRSLAGPSFAQDAWQAGLRLSTIASSDDHRSQPGSPHWGLVAVRAPELTRDAIFQALHDRRTYATTGSRIVLDFTVDGEGMGGLVVVDGPPRVAVSAHGTDTIALVEVLRYRPEDKRFDVVRTWRPGTIDFTGRFVDEGHRRGAVYYARLRQSNTVRGRVVMAWSSPIWTR